eukprot:CFRG3393T1
MSDSTQATPSRKPLGVLRNISNTPSHTTPSKSTCLLATKKRNGANNFTPSRGLNMTRKKQKFDLHVVSESVDENGNVVGVQPIEQRTETTQLVADLRLDNEQLKQRCAELTEQVENTTYALKLVADDYDAVLPHKEETVSLKKEITQHLLVLDAYSTELENLREKYNSLETHHDKTLRKARSDLQTATNYGDHYRLMYEAMVKSTDPVSTNMRKDIK